MVLITGGLSRTAALCCHRPKHTPASLQITVYLYTSLLPSYTSPLPLLSSFLPCVRTFHLCHLPPYVGTRYFRVWIPVFVLPEGEERGGEREGEGEREGLDGTTTKNRIRRMDRGNEISYSFPQIDAERLAYGGVLSGNGYFAPGTRDSVDSSVKYKNDTEGGSKEDIPISIFFLLLFSFPFFFLYRETIERVYSFVRRWSTISKKLIASYFPRTF